MINPRAKLPGWLTGLLVVGEFCLLVALELRRPLRKRSESTLNRVARNLSMAGLSAVAVSLAETPVVRPLAALVEQRKFGLLQQLSLPKWLEVVFGAALMDYTLYLWHRLMHGWDQLWRFHLPHHVDLDLDASNALHFHFSELVLSVPWRVGQVLLIGITPFSFSIWQTALMLSILFQHSNVRLPIEVERRLNYLIVTPRMHGIHHSMVRAEENSNWSSGLTLWDFLHGTLKLNVAQSEITIGVPAYRDADEVQLVQIIAMPFKDQRATWQLPDHSEPLRAPSSTPAIKLLP